MREKRQRINNIFNFFSFIMPVLGVIKVNLRISEQISMKFNIREFN